MNRAHASIIVLCSWPALGLDSAVPQDAAFLDAMHADVRRMEYASNTERGETLQAILRDRGIEFSLEQFQNSSRAKYLRSAGTNIVVTLGEGSETIVIGGHYDAVWLPDGTLSPGAVDNAGSSIILTRVAEALSAETLDHRVEIVFFDMEEIGLLGSRDFVQRRSSDSIAAAINLDVNGYGDTLFYPTNSAASGSLQDVMISVCEAQGFSCRGFSNYPASDYLSFQRAGIPNLSLAILPSDEVDELYVALNPEPGVRPPATPPSILRLIHSPDDQADRVDPAGMEITYRAVLELVREL